MAGEPSLPIWTEEALPASYSESTTSTSRVPRCLTGMAGTVEAGAHATATTAPTASPAASLTRPLFVRSPGKAALIVYTASGTGSHGLAGFPLDPQHVRYERPGVGTGVPGDVLGGPHRHHPAARVPPFRSEVHDPVGRLDHVQVVLDDQDRVARRHQAVQHRQELPDVFEG